MAVDPTLYSPGYGRGCGPVVLTDCGIIEYALHRPFACFDTSHSKLAVRSDIVETGVTLRNETFMKCDLE